jgi:mono/diheme cytochrome c family protein
MRDTSNGASCGWRAWRGVVQRDGLANTPAWHGSLLGGAEQDGCTVNSRKAVLSTNLVRSARRARCATSDRDGDFPFRHLLVIGTSRPPEALRMSRRATLFAALCAIAAPILLAAQPAAKAPDGKALYEQRCIACHQPTGAGLPGAFPPLAGSEWVTGKPDAMIRIVLHGLQGPISVKGANYNAAMIPYGTGAAMNDAEVAAVLSYVRSSFGNKAAPVTAAQVAAARAATAKRTTPFTAPELIALK